MWLCCSTCIKQPFSLNKKSPGRNFFSLCCHKSKTHCSECRCFLYAWQKANGSHCPWRRSWSRLGCLGPVQSHRSSPPSRGWPVHSWLPGLCERTRRKRPEWQWLWCMTSERDVSSRFRFTIVTEDSDGATIVTHPESTWLIPRLPQLQFFESLQDILGAISKNSAKRYQWTPKEASSSCLPVRECEEQSLLALGIKL